MEENLPVQSGSPGLVERAKGILMKPAEEWTRIAGESAEPKSVLLTYALPLMLIGPICTVLGSFLAPYSLGLTFYLSTAIVGLILAVCQLYALAFIANFLSTKFGGKDSFPSAFKLVAYAWTPAWLLGVIGLLVGFAPVLGVLAFLAMAYGLYLFYLGAGPLMGVPQEQTAVYTVIYVVAAIVFYIIVSAITAAVVASFVVASSPALVLYR